MITGLKVTMQEELDLNAQLTEATLVEYKDDNQIDLVKGEGYTFFFDKQELFFEEADVLSADVAYVAEMLVEAKVIAPDVTQVLVLDEVELLSKDVETVLPAFLMKLDDYCARYHINYITFMHAAIYKGEGSEESYLKLFKDLGYESTFDQDNGHHILYRDTRVNAPYHA